MELSIKTVITITLIIMVLVILSFFITSQSSAQVARSDVNRVFSTKCQEYNLKECDWTVTKEKDFEEFLSACRSLYGSESESYSCLYLRCPACSKAEINKGQFDTQLRCASLCEQCEGDEKLGVKSTCCQQFASQCSESIVRCAGTCP